MGRVHKQKGKPDFSKNSLQFLNVVMILAFLSAAVQIATTVIVDWRKADGITYPYMYRSSEKYITIGITKYGLYRVSYDDGGHSETWNQRIINMKSAGTVAIQQGNNDESAGSASLLISSCPAPCRSAINTRIGTYERVANVSLILLCAIVVSCSIVLLSIGWNLLFSKNILVLMGCFILAFIVDTGVGGYWFSETDEAWDKVINVQVFPFPRCSYCFYIFMGTTAMFGICFLCLLIIDLVNKNKQKQSHIEKLNMRNKDPINANNMYQPLFGDQNNMMMQRNASYSNIMPFNKNTNSEFPNFMQYNKMSMDPMGGFPTFRNSQPNMNPNFFPQMSRQYSYSGVPPPHPFQQNLQNFGNFPTRNMPSMSDLNFARQYSGMNYNNINNPNSQKPFKF